MNWFESLSVGLLRVVCWVWWVWWVCLIASASLASLGIAQIVARVFQHFVQRRQLAAHFAQAFLGLLAQDSGSGQPGIALILDQSPDALPFLFRRRAGKPLV